MISYAIIDIGSNSVRLMLWADGKTLYKKLETTRMGAGLSASGCISETAMLATVQAVRSFCEEGRAAGAQVYAFATAAVRMARNGKQLCRAVQESCGLFVDVVSGETEAALGTAGALGEDDGGIVDIGGASTEVDFQEKGKTIFSVSMGLGAVKLLDLCADDKSRLDATIDNAISCLENAKGSGAVYAIGGTASTLACIACETTQYDASLNGTLLSKEFVHKTALQLLALSVEERKKIRGMEENRADIIAGGVYLLDKVMQKLGLSAVIFSDADNLEGYLRLKILGQREES